TPTAAANIIVDRFNSLRNRVENYSKDMIIYMDKVFFKRSQRFDILSLKLDKNSPGARIGMVKDFLLFCQNSMISVLNYKIKDFDSALDYFNSYIKNNGPLQKLNQFKSRIELIEHKIKDRMFNREKTLLDYISNVEFMLKSLDPTNLLKKGYCIVKKGDKIVSDVGDVALEDILEIKVKNGYIKSSVVAKKILEE
ncbi:MAG: hypothetical protein LDL10_05020, partial [Calditerrivibrio sp.]|nr:hypothetical protein [Calditerrivibrio sp.]